MNPLEQVIYYLERRLMYAREDLELGVMPGVQNAVELEQVRVRIYELMTTLAFVKHLDHMYPPQSTPASSE